MEKKSNSKEEIVSQEMKDLEELKFFFGVHDKYPRLYDFEKRVLKPAEEELETNDDAPYWFTYDKVKKGRKVAQIKFNVHVRREALLRKAPDIRIIQKNTPTLFDQNEDVIFSKGQKALIEKLVGQGIREEFALRVISNLTETQGSAYLALIQYGVNRNLAFNIVKDHCSFGELKDYESFYVQHTLEIIEEARIKRLNNEKTKKRTTPKSKRGGLPKKVFEERQHFSSFMEKLSSIRKEKKNSHNEGKQGRGLSEVQDLAAKMRGRS